MTAVFIFSYLFIQGLSLFWFYTLCVILGTSIGYWAVFVTTASEQFGTNLRSTVTTTVQNFIRGTVIPITLAFEFLREYIGMIYSVLIVGTACLLLDYYALNNLEETFGKDLNYLENI